MLKRILFALVYSNLWIALSAGAQVWVQFQLMNAPVSWEAVLLATLSMYWVYTFAKAVHFDPEADALNDPERTAFLKRHRVLLIATGLAGLALGSVLSYRNGSATLAVFLAPLIAGLAYDLKVLPKSWSYRRLKDITGIKGVVVATAWTVLTVGLPLQYGAAPSIKTLVIVSTWGFLNWFVNTTYFDLGDLTGDRVEQTMTIPVRYGYKPTKLLLHVLNILAFASYLLALRAGWLPSNTAPTSLIALNNLAILWRAKDEDTDISLECDVVADGLFLAAALYLAVS